MKFNKSIELGTFLSKLKMAKVIPIFKSDDETDPNNYRPISLLSCFNSNFENLVFKRLKSFIDERQIISSSQYGFRQGHSTEHVILDNVNSIQSNMDAGKFSCGVFVDLKKAFDTVDHGILLQKLAHNGFRGLINDWFRSYLQDRAQVTVVGNRSSNKSLITWGVPQGSVLGTFSLSPVCQRHLLQLKEIEILHVYLLMIQIFFIATKTLKLLKKK